MNILRILQTYHAPTASPQTIYLIAAIWGILLPTLTAVIQQPRWSDRRRAVVGAFISIIAGIVVSIQHGAFTGQSILACVLITTIAAWTSFRNFWHPSQIAPWIEQLTSALPNVLAAVQQGAAAGYSTAASAAAATHDIAPAVAVIPAEVATELSGAGVAAPAAAQVNVNINTPSSAVALANDIS